MDGAEIVLAAVQVVAAAGGAWLAVRVELRWLRADVDRHEKKLEHHDTRMHALEISK
jgi:hypothetical protein